MRKLDLALAVGLLAATAPLVPHSGGARSAELNNQAPASLSRQIVGTWRLNSIYEEGVGGADIAEFGPTPRGFFMADRLGNFFLQLTSNEAGAVSPTVVVPSAGVFEDIVYFGTYAVGEQEQKLTLHVASCLFRSCARTERTAELRIHGDTMELISSAETSPTGAFYSNIVWKRDCCS